MTGVIIFQAALQSLKGEIVAYHSVQIWPVSPFPMAKRLSQSGRAVAG